MSQYNGVKLSSVLSAIDQYTDKLSSTDSQDLQDILAMDGVLLDDVLGSDFFERAAATGAMDAESASRHMGVDREIEEGFNSWFFNLMTKKLGKNFFSSPRGDSAAVIEERNKALAEFYSIAKAKLLSSISKTYSEYMRTPDAKRVTVRKMILDPKKGEFVEDKSTHRVEIEIPGTDFEGRFDFEEALDALKKKGIQELKSSKKDDFERTTHERSYNVFTQKKSEDKNYKGELVPTKYSIEVRDIGEFLEKSQAYFNPGELASQIPSILADMFTYFEGKADHDVNGEGSTSLDKAILGAFSGEEGADKQSVYRAGRDLDTVFAPKIDAQRLTQLVKLHGGVDAGSKTAFNLKDLNVEDFVDAPDIEAIKIGDPDTFLIDELRTKKDIMYKIKDLAFGKGDSLILTISFPDFEASGFLDKGQTYTIKTPDTTGFEVGQEYHLSTLKEESPKERAIQLRFKEQSKGNESAGIETAKEVGLTGPEIKKLTQKLTDTFVSSLKSMPKEDFIKYFGKMVVLNGKVMADSSDLGALVQSEEADFDRSDDGIGGEGKALKYIEDFKEDAEHKEDSVKDFWGRDDIVHFILNQGLEKKDSPLVHKIVQNFPDRPSNTKVLTKVFQSRSFIKWLLDTIAYGTSGMVDKIDKTNVWSALVQKKLEDGDIFKESPEFDTLYTGERNDLGGIAGVGNRSNFLIYYMKPLIDAIEESVMNMYLEGDKYLMGLLRVNTGKLDEPLSKFKLKYEGGKGADGKAHTGIDNTFNKALDQNDSRAIMGILNFTPETMTKKNIGVINAIQNADVISKEDRKYLVSIFEDMKRAEKKELTRRALFPRTRVQREASTDKSMLSLIVNTVMSRRGFYNV